MATVARPAVEERTCRGTFGGLQDRLLRFTCEGQEPAAYGFPSDTFPPEGLPAVRTSAVLTWVVHDRADGGPPAVQWRTMEVPGGAVWKPGTLLEALLEEGRGMEDY